MADTTQDRQSTYWKHVCLWTAAGVLMWLGITFGVSWWSQFLDQWHIGGLPAGYWWATQGAIGAYLVIIVGYGRVMDRLEARAAPDELPEDARRAAALNHD